MKDSKYMEAAQLLPPEMRHFALAAGARTMKNAEEFRLRMHRRPTIVIGGAEREFEYREAVEKEDLEYVLERATEASMHSAAGDISSGFVTAHGGHRIGVCGTAIEEDGVCRGIRSVSSVNVRIARQIKGIAEPLMDSLIENGTFISTLIISPPGSGKTTLLRDIIRCLSEKMRCAVADERGEIAAMCKGGAQFDLGRHTDVISGRRKAQALMMLIRAMNPQVAAVDEISDKEDWDAVSSAAGCGVKLLASIHAQSIEQLKTRRFWTLFEEIFEKAIVISNVKGRRTYTVHDLRERQNV